MPKPFFSTGTSRGGTTFFARLLNVNPQLSLTSDPFLPLIRSLRTAIARTRYPAFDADNALDDYYFSTAKTALLDHIQSGSLDLPFSDAERPVLREQLAKRMNLAAKNCIAHLDLLQGATYRDMFASGLRLLAAANNAQDRAWVGFNDNWAIEFLPLFHRAFPEARFIIILRDPRAAVCSAMAQPDPTRRPSVLSFCRHWRKYAAFIHRYQIENTLNGRLFFMQYEDFVRDPETNLRRLCSILEVPYDPNMTDSSQFKDSTGQPWKNNSHFQVGKKGIYQDAISSWRKNMAPEAAEFVEFMTEPEMRLYRYEPEFFSGPTLSAAAMRFIQENSKLQMSWKGDFNSAEYELEIGKELFRRQALTLPEDIVTADMQRRLFLFPAFYHALRQSQAVPVAAR